MTGTPPREGAHDWRKNWADPTPEMRAEAAAKRLAARNVDANDALIDHGPQAVKAAVSAATIPLIRPGSLAEHGKSTEETLAREWVHIHRPSWRFDHGRGRWFHWDGSRWRVDETKLALELMRQHIRHASEAEKRLLGKASFAKGMETFAQIDQRVAVTADVWDRDPYLIGVPGGTLDLRTGAVSTARPEDMITKQAGAAPEHAEPELWLAFLEQATGGDREMIRFLRQMAGYCLTGLTKEHALFFIYGPGGNGKSVFLNILNFILGDYATTASMDTFTASRSDRHPTDLAMLAGARLVSASETEEGRAWAEARIKQLTGGDRIAARFMRQDFFEFVPQFKLVIVGNHAPVLHNVDEAMRRRFNIVPFTHKPERPDRHLEDKLRQEAGRILAWMIDGCEDWQANGLVRPAIVKSATDDYFDGQDLIGQWLDERCDVGTGKAEKARALFQDWRGFALTAGEEPGSEKSFKPAIERRGFRHKRTKTGSVYEGLALRPFGNPGGR